MTHQLFLLYILAANISQLSSQLHTRYVENVLTSTELGRCVRYPLHNSNFLCSNQCYVYGGVQKSSAMMTYHHR